MLILLTLKPALSVTILHTSFINKLITSAGVFNGVLPLQIELVALLMQSFKFFCCFIELNLSGLCLSHLLLKLISLSSNLYGKFLNLKCKLLDFGFISTSKLLKSQVIFFLLARGKSPLLKLLLIPVHLQFKLVHALVCFEDHVLNIVQSILLVSNPLFQLLNFVSQTTTLTLCNLLEVLLSFNFLVLGVDKALSVHKLHLNRLEMLFQNLQPLLMLFNL